jgi:hypothetical protein
MYWTCFFHSSPSSQPPPPSHRGATCGNKITPSSAQLLPAEIPAGDRPLIVDIARCLSGAVIERLQVPAGVIGEEIPPVFFETTLPQVVELGGVALPDHQQGDPPAAFAATAACAGRWYRGGRFHISVSPSLPENYATGKD